MKTINQSGSHMIARRLLLSLWYIVALVMAVWLLVRIGEM